MRFFFSFKLPWLFSLCEWASCRTKQLNWSIAYAYCSHLKSFAGISEIWSLILPEAEPGTWEELLTFMGLKAVWFKAYARHRKFWVTVIAASALVVVMNLASLWSLSVLLLTNDKGWDLGKTAVRQGRSTFSIVSWLIPGVNLGFTCGLSLHIYFILWQKQPGLSLKQPLIIVASKLDSA